MTEQEKFYQLAEKYPHPHKFCATRPHLTRRHFFQLAGAGVAMGCFARPAEAGVVIKSQPVTMQNKAKNVIFVLMAGAPSHTDLFDLKVVNGVTPASFAPASINGVNWPTGLLPKLATQLTNQRFSVVRTMRAWALVHTLSQTWTQIGRNPAAALGNIAPNIGSVVSIEKEPQRVKGQVFPTFLSLNAGNTQVGNGYFAANFAPMRLGEPGGANANNTGLASTTNQDGQAMLNERYSQLQTLDSALRTNSPYGRQMEDMADFYSQAIGLTYNPVVDGAFRYTAADSARYGGTSFGNACLVAKQVLAAKQGTRFVQITVGGWDMHVNIYQANNLNPASPTALNFTFDNGMSALLDDLNAAGILNDTLVVAVGEFGRTTGNITGAGGRDHFLQQSAFFAGGGITGGKAIGSTDTTGSNSLDYGWSAKRDVKPEDIEATIYSALGINWTTIRYDDPFGRGFEYVPQTGVVYQPINELWA